MMCDTMKFDDSKWKPKKRPGSISKAIFTARTVVRVAQQTNGPAVDATEPSFLLVCDRVHTRGGCAPLPSILPEATSAARGNVCRESVLLDVLLERAKGLCVERLRLDPRFRPRLRRRIRCGSRLQRTLLLRRAFLV